MTVADFAVYKDLLIALASVGAVLWTGGLIVLQLRRAAAPDLNQHHLINAGMACAAYGFLAPLLGLLADGAIMQKIAIAAAVLYVCMTIGNVKTFFQGLVFNNDTIVYTSIGYLLPTVALIVIAIWSLEVVVVWSAGLLIFVSYFILSRMAREFP